jgi:hypothetical protein
MSVRWAVVILAMISLWTVSANADDVADFYRGKTVTIVVGSDAGGGYDLTARALARVIGRYIPGSPQVIVQNKPGASSMIAAKFVSQVAPRDGTVIAAVQRPVPFNFLFANGEAGLDLRKLQWLGSVTKEPGVFVVWHTTPFRSVGDLLAQEVIVGGNGASNDTELFARVLNSILGTKLKIVSGYPGQNAIVLAMERGEVQGVANWSWSDIVSRHPDWIADKKVNFLLQLSLENIPALASVPNLLEFARTDDERNVLRLLLEMKALGRPCFLAEGVPPARIAALRAAFDSSMKDESFLEEAAKMLGPVDPVSGEDMQQMLGEVYALPADVIKKAREAVGTASP